MEHDERFQAWIRWRAEFAAPPGFADKVMAAVAERSRQRTVFRARLLTLLLSRPGRIALCVLAGLACAFRALQVLAVFVP
jgi:hypothetical protein